MKVSSHVSRVVTCLSVVALMSGCAQLNEQMGGMSRGGKTAAGAGAGAVVGAGLGALIGDTGTSAAIGAGIGAVAGGIAGYNWAGVKNDVQKSGATSLGIDVVEMPDGTLKVNIPSNVSFDTGRYALKPALLPVLDSVARALVQHPELRAKSVGYTDNTGSAATNQTLSINRAQAVSSYLSQHGVPAGNISAEGRGPSSPVADNSTVEGRAMNRRVELFLYAIKK